jgi:putative AdoMet-dependent methyltransferase
MEIESLFPPSDFDQWAESYDRDVLDGGRFPFVGYQSALETVFRLAEAKPGMKVLDLGTGTGNLAAFFAQTGCQVWGIDFSEAMLVKARQKLPGVTFLLADLGHDLPLQLPGSFDRIVSAYAFHHFDLSAKVHIIQRLVSRLTAGGKLVFADIAFADQAALQWVRQMVGEDWEDEFYWLADETLPALEQAGLLASFTPASTMAGVFTVLKP